MTNLIDVLVPDELGRWSSPCYQPTAPAVRRAAPRHPGPQLLRRDHLHGSHLDTMAAAARPRAWLRLASDVLAPADRVGQRRRVRPTPPRGLGPAGERDDLDAGECGHHERAGQARGDHVGANPVDRGKPGSKLHLVCDGRGLPLTAAVTAANVNDTTMFQAILEALPPVRRPSGQRRTRPGAVHADKAYDHAANRAYLRRGGIRPRIARRGMESPTRLGRHRWRIERTLSWLSCYRRPGVRWDRDSGRWFALVLLACSVVCFNRL